MGESVSAGDSEHLIDKWTNEYEMGGCPSSTRTSCSGAVQWAVETLREHFALQTAVDIGCGKGRNSIYLAEQGMNVTAMDFTPRAIESLNETIAQRKLPGKIRAIIHDVTEDWPMPRMSVDLAIDGFCFKHITPHDARISYKANLLRVLRMRGHYMISFASIGDGYYGRYVVERGNGDEGPHLAIDPANGIPSLLFTRKYILQFFAPELDLYDEIHHNRPYEMHGQVYESSTYALLLKRNPHHTV